MPPATPAAAPSRWRGFNLLSMFLHPSDHRFRDMLPWEPAGFRELDFRWIADWGFNCVRLPLCWRIWSSRADPTRVDEREIAKIDRALRYAERTGLHVVLCLHEAPGYGICARPEDGYDLWRDAPAQEAFVQQWRSFATRYRGIAAARLTFNLLNEPSRCTPEAHARVMRAAVAAIRAIDPERPIALDGREVGNQAAADLVDLGVTHCCRGYMPVEISHLHAWWLAVPDQPLTWPIYLPHWNQTVTKESLRNVLRDQGFLALRAQGIPVQCGETGAYNETPHEVLLPWLTDYLAVLREEGIGFLLWNFRGSVGILDSQRADVAYEPWYGHQLDRQLLEVLQQA